MVFAYFEIAMEDIRIYGNLDLEIKKPGFTQVTRANHFRYAYKNGKSLFSFVYVKKGTLQYYFNTLKKSICVEQGSSIFIPKGLPYQATYLQDDTTIKILTYDVKKSNPLTGISLPKLISNPEQTLVFSSISKQNMYSPLFLCSKIYELLHYLGSADNTIPNKYNKLLPALLDLQQQYFKNEKISYYAGLCSMSESNFRKLFKEYTGNNPITYRNLIRISAAAALLNTGEATISEAAYLVGFNNMSFFYQVYNKYKQN